MRKAVLHALYESRWRSAACFIAAAAMVPATAQASTKLLNQKPMWDKGATCPVDAGGVFAPVRIAPSRIILNGAPSALDRIRMSQDSSGQAEGFAGIAANRPLEPASGVRSVGNGAASSGDCGIAGALPRWNRPSFAPTLGFPAPSADYDPSAELGTKAIPIKKTRFDARWSRVRRAPSAGLMQAQLRGANAGIGLDESELLARVNRWVNRQFAYINDDENYGVRDFWATAEQTVARGSGDCEDLAILKMHMLRAAGVREDRMKLVLLRDLAANADHAFLLVQTKAGKVVLDNMTDRVYDGSAANYVRPILSFSANKRWVHAYQDHQPAPLAAAVPAAQRSFAVAINNYRSVSADPLTFKTGFSK